MASYVPVIKNGSGGAILYVGLVSQADTRAFQSNPTIASGDFKVSLDGGALANLSTLPAVTPASSKMVKITLSQAETNADNVTVVCADAAGSEWCDLIINIQTVARQIDDIPTANQNADALLDRSDAIEAGLTPRGALRLNTAVLAGKVSGAGSGTEVFRNAVADSKARITATVDSSGDRTAITADPT